MGPSASSSAGDLDIERRIAQQLATLRAEHGWSLDALAERTGISRATLSRLERSELSPTAAMLGTLCTVYGWTLSRLMAEAETQPPNLVPSAQQATWTDPESRYRRRIVSPPAPGLRGELVEVHLPPERSSRSRRHRSPGLEHHLWMLDGALTLAGRRCDVPAADRRLSALRAERSDAIPEHRQTWSTLPHCDGPAMSDAPRRPADPTALSIDVWTPAPSDDAALARDIGCSPRSCVRWCTTEPASALSSRFRSRRLGRSGSAGCCPACAPARVTCWSRDSAGASWGPCRSISPCLPINSIAADVLKLLVHPDARRQGIARALMLAVEPLARSGGKTLLTLDTWTGGHAEVLYRSLGYVTVGVIPRYARGSLTPALEPATFMYKELTTEE